MGSRVVVVTADPLVLEELRFGLPGDVELRSARDAREAHRMLEGYVPDVVVIDIHTGSAGGFATARDMRADGRLADVPVIMLLERPQDEWLARQAGARVVRIKPVDGQQLASDIATLLRTDPAATG